MKKKLEEEIIDILIHLGCGIRRDVHGSVLTIIDIVPAYKSKTVFAFLKLVSDEIHFYPKQAEWDRERKQWKCTGDKMCIIQKNNQICFVQLENEEMIVSDGCVKSNIPCSL